MKTYSLLIAFFFFSISQAQTLTRSAIGTFGASITKNNLMLQQIAGQSSTSGTVITSGQILRQGFIQPPQLLGIEASNNIYHIRIYPNPSSGVFNFVVESSNGTTMNYKIYDITGRIIASQPALFNIPVSVKQITFAQGVYFLVITDGAKICGTQKIVITSN